MNTLINPSAMSMTSQEIADLVESRHDNVRVTIQRLAEKQVIALPAMQEKPTAGRPTQVYVFSGEQGKRDSIIVVAQLSPEFTARLVDRWQELEKLVEQRDPMEMLNDPTVLRQALLGYSEKVIALEARVQEQTPKVEALDRLATANGSLCITDAAKVLQAQPKKLFAWLRENRWIYRRAGGTGYLGYQDRIMTGLLEHKVNVVLREDGSEKVVEQVRVTPKGLTKIAKTLEIKVAA